MQSHLTAAVLLVMIAGIAGATEAQTPTREVPEGISGMTPLHATLEYVAQTYLDPRGLRGELLPLHLGPDVPPTVRHRLEDAPVRVALFDQLHVCEEVPDDLPACATRADPFAVSVHSIEHASDGAAVVKLFRYQRNRLPDGRPGPTMGVAELHLHLHRSGEIWTAREVCFRSSALFMRLVPWPANSTPSK